MRTQELRLKLLRELLYQSPLHSLHARMQSRTRVPENDTNQILGGSTCKNVPGKSRPDHTPTAVNRDGAYPRWTSH